MAKRSITDVINVIDGEMVLKWVGEHSLITSILKRQEPFPQESEGDAPWGNGQTCEGSRIPSCRCRLWCGVSPEPRNAEASGRWEQPSAESQQENGTSVPEQQGTELGSSPNEPGNESSLGVPRKKHSAADALILVWRDPCHTSDLQSWQRTHVCWFGFLLFLFCFVF